MIRYNKLFAVLQLKGLRVLDLANATKTSQATFAKMRKGGAVSTDTIDKVCCYLNVQPADIMEYIPEPTPTDPID